MPLSREEKMEFIPELPSGDAQERAATEAVASTPMLPSQVLDAAADLIEPEGRWTQGANARTAKGRPIGPVEAPASCWCAIGAIQYCAHGHSGRAWSVASFGSRVVARGSRDYGALARWNDRDGRTQAEVVKALRDAAELARSEGR